MKNFQEKRGQCDSQSYKPYSPKTFSFKGSKNSLDLCLADNRILYFWYVVESIHIFIIEPYVLQCLFVSEPNKKQRRGKIIILNFTKGGTFSSPMTTKCSLG